MASSELSSEAFAFISDFYFAQGVYKLFGHDEQGSNFKITSAFTCLKISADCLAKKYGVLRLEIENLMF